MRRRLLIAIVGTVVAAVVLAGFGTLALSRLGARRYAESEVRRQAEALADSLPGELGRRPLTNAAERRRFLRSLQIALRLEGVDVLVGGPGDRLTGTLPDGVEIDDLDQAALDAGNVVSGHHGSLVYAAAPRSNGVTTTVVVLTRRSDVELGAAVPWFLLAAGVTIALGAAVAIRLSKALTAPLAEAEAASRKIAAGDLTARVPTPAPSANDEVSDLSRSVNAMAEALERSRGLEQQFLMSVSHDLRTPLTSIKGYAEALADGTMSEPARAGEIIRAESARLERLVRDLLALAQLDARRFSFTPSDLELPELVDACVEGFAQEAATAGVRLVRAPGPAVSVHADPDRLAQVVANLVENALKFARSQISVAVEHRGTAARVLVDDDGAGIAPSDLPHVFERLYVATHTPVRKESGSGLGLAIVRELVAAMGGTVGADTSPTLGGARLWIELPALRSA